MAWRNDNQEGSSDLDRFLKIESPKNKGEVSRVTLRVLDPEPEGAWRHWYARRPFNCPGKQGKCPVCEVRAEYKLTNPSEVNKKYQMEFVYFFNVLVDGQVKIWSFKNKVGEKLREFIHEYGDLRNYDIVVAKRKTGPLDINIEWDVIYRGPRELTDEEQAAVEEKHDLLKEVQLPDHETLLKVAREENLETKQAEEQNEDEEPSSGSSLYQKLVAIAESKGKTVSDYGVDSKTSERVLKAILAELSD